MVAASTRTMIGEGSGEILSARAGMRDICTILQDVLAQYDLQLQVGRHASQANDRHEASSLVPLSR
jgi:hypothetical protein